MTMTPSPLTMYGVAAALLVANATCQLYRLTHSLDGVAAVGLAELDGLRAIPREHPLTAIGAIGAESRFLKEVFIDTTDSRMSLPSEEITVVRGKCRIP